MRRERGQAVVNQATVNGRYTDAKITVNGDWAIERYTGVLRVTPKTGGAATEDVIKASTSTTGNRMAVGAWCRTSGTTMPPEPARVQPPAK
jgi:hypothetical protein